MTFPFACPLPAEDADVVLLAHGEGGPRMRRLIAERILPRFDNPILRAAGDAARLTLPGPDWAFTADSFVVAPLFFPGGDIGRLAVHGTANDLAVAGARPRFLSLSLILEEGLPLATLDRVLDSVRAAAREAQVLVVAGDTKVVPRGAADGLFLATTGLGELLSPIPPGPAALRPGDELVLSGPPGRHGAAVLCAREQLGFDPPPATDCGPLFPACEALREAQVTPRAMRDATRGGLAAVLHEWAEASGQSLALEESLLPRAAEIVGVCELLGLDPLHLASEGTMLVAVPAGSGARAQAALREAGCTQAACVGAVRPRGAAAVTIRGLLGVERPLDEPWNQALPRIC